MLPQFSQDVQNLPRVQLLRVRALLAVGEVEQAMQILTPDFVMPDIREGELSVSALWYEMYTAYLMKAEGVEAQEARLLANVRYPLPYALDFRMHE